MPGRPKTGKLDSVWLATCTERGALRPSFVPPAGIRILRDYTRLPRGSTSSAASGLGGSLNALEPLRQLRLADGGLLAGFPAGDRAQPGRSSGRLAASWPCSRPVDWPTSMR